MDPTTAAILTGATAGVAADMTLAELPKVAPNFADWLGMVDKQNRDVHGVLTVIEQHLHQLRRMQEQSQISDTREVAVLSKSVQTTIADRGYAHFVIFCPGALTVTITIDGLAWNVALSPGPNLVDAPGNSYAVIQSTDTNATMNVLFIWTNRSYGNPV